ncbi:MAG TPA: c-type cytochrome [Gammaproteobacteria bacterium]|nr:c-type cytochrome [Gammaproteobacteria bacterium]
MISITETGLFFLFFSLLVTNPVLAEDHERGDKYQPVRNQLQQCFACHGETGAPASDATASEVGKQRIVKTTPVPILAGQEFFYLYTQLKDFKSGLRENEIMSPIVSSLEKDDMKLIAEYFSEQQWPENNYKASASETNTGKKVIGSAECTACHLGAFNGNSRVPRLAGQHPDYMAKTMKDMKNGIRKNATAMSSLMKTFSEQEIKAVSAYLAAFKEED